jgi:glyoxylase-like metal-dependent hydrolase (beta-lactamase superfamily II)
MDIKIYPIPLGFDTCYIIQDKGIVMIDGGAPKKAKDFLKALEKISIKPEEVQLIVITHGHWDHIGSVREIKEITRAKIAMHQLEKDWLERPSKQQPPGANLWGRLFSTVIKMFLPLIRIPSTNVDLVLEAEDFSLAEYGIPGKVIYTPGHSSGSVSVLLETGDVFVGDMAMNKFPVRLSPGLPIFAEDFKKVKESWKLLLDQGIKKIYPAHGEPFSADIIQRAL